MDTIRFIIIKMGDIHAFWFFFSFSLQTEQKKIVMNYYVIERNMESSATNMVKYKNNVKCKVLHD